MAEPTLDFWPDIEAARPKITPLSLMKQQAALLGKHTGNLLEGQVDTRPVGSDLMHKFTIKVPALGYEYELFRVRQRVAELYPIIVLAAPKLGEERKGELSSEGEFLQWLKDVLNSDATKRVLGSLLAQSETK